MRDLALVGLILMLLPLAAARPFIGVMLWSWVSFMNPHRLGWDIASGLPLAMIAFGITVIGCIVAREPKRLALNGVTVLLVVFMACITVTSFTALGHPDSVWSKWEMVVKIILGLLITAALLTDRWRIHALIWLMVIALAYFGVKGGAFTLLTGGGHIVLGPDGTIIGDRNHLAVALLVTIPLMNYLRMHSAHRIVRIGLIVAMLLMLFSIVGSQSRGALLGLAATASVFWLRSRGKVVTGVLIATGVAAAIAFMPAIWTERMRTLETYEEDRSAMGRVEIWLAAWEIVKARPLVGGGFRAVYDQEIVNRYYLPGTRAKADHSIWFEVLGEQGFPAFFVWLGIIAAGVFYSLRITSLARDRPDLRWAYDLARMAQVSVVAYCSGGTFLSLGYWDFFWTLMVVLAATHALVLQAVRAPGRFAAAAGARRDTRLTTGESA
jgi:probable O-glycosylation ligase (exosortase A-associated)